MNAYTPKSTSIDLGRMTVRATLLSTTATKVAKGLKYGVQTGVMYLSPAALATDARYLRTLATHVDDKLASGHLRPTLQASLRRVSSELETYLAQADGVANARFNLCLMSTRGCRSLCLGLHSGHHRLQLNLHSQVAQVRRTRYLMRDPGGFLRTLDREIRSLHRASIRRGMDTAIRLDGTSDIWLAGRTWIAASNPGCNFYDYTKDNPMRRTGNHARAHLTYSVSESRKSWQIGAEYMRSGGCAAVVVDRETHATAMDSGDFRGFPVLDGDASDLRYLDTPGHAVLLKAKGKPAIEDRTGFVYRSALQVIQ